MSMDVQFWYTSSKKLEGLKPAAGRIIALNDQTGYFYDMETSPGQVKRFRVNNIQFVEGGLAGLNARIDKFEDAVAMGDPEAILDVLYITCDGVFKYTPKQGDEKTGKFVDILPIYVKQAPSDDIVYGRHNGHWTDLHWMVLSEDTNLAMIENHMQSLIQLGAASLKLSGTLNNTIQIKLEEPNTSFALDLQDIQFGTESVLKITLAATTHLKVSGVVEARDVYVYGTGDITFNSCTIKSDIYPVEFCGTISILNSTLHNSSLICTSGDPPGVAIITGCSWHIGSIDIADYKRMISNNWLNNVNIADGDTSIDASYNNTINTIN